MSDLTPREVVSELDKYIIGQNEAKRVVAIALRNRWRRRHVRSDLRDEILPKNIIMVGPTGVGKTEIARRLAMLTKVPFLKVEITKYTEVGYVGKDVESMIRDLVNLSVKMVQEEENEKYLTKAGVIVEERLLDMLLEKKKDVEDANNMNLREEMRRKLAKGELDDRLLEVKVKEAAKAPFEVLSFYNTNMDEIENSLKEMLGNIMPQRQKRKKITVAEARKVLLNEELQKLVDMDKVTEIALDRAQNYGIIFLDEIDKIVAGGGNSGPDVSREGVQRDILPLVEGCNVSTKYGMVKTSHILFIAAGAFHLRKPSDLMPELQGRFPLRVELRSLTKDDFIKILRETKNSLVKQYIALMATEGVGLDFSSDGIEELARIAEHLNNTMEDIGARRLHTVIERVLEDISFTAPDRTGQTIIIDKGYVIQKLEGIIKDEDLSKYVL